MKKEPKLKKIEPKGFLRQNWMLIAAILYVLSPIDFLPDFLPTLGFADDILVLLGTLTWRYFKFKTGAGKSNKSNSPEKDIKDGELVEE